MYEFAVEYLFCPETQSPLRVEATNRVGEHIMEGTLVSVADPAHCYPICNGVPCFVSIERLEGEQRDTVAAFAEKWSRIPDYGQEQMTKRSASKVTLCL